MSNEQSVGVADGQQGLAVEQSQSNQSFSVPNTVPDTTTESADAKSFQDMIPEQYRDKRYMNKIKDIPSLFESLDNAQELLGKKPRGVPQPDEGEEAWNDFYKELGRPDTPEGYELKMPELPEGMQSDDEQLNAFKKLGFDNGLTPKQMQALLDFDLERQKTALGKFNEQNAVSQKQMNDELETMFKKRFGDKLEDAIGNSNKLLEKYAPPEFLEKVHQLDNSTLVVLTSVLDGITHDYIREDQPLRGETRMAQSADDLIGEARKLMQSEAYRNPFNVEHDATKRKVDELYQAWGRKTGGK